jgi:hypothetical protein
MTQNLTKFRWFYLNFIIFLKYFIAMEPLSYGAFPLRFSTAQVEVEKLQNLVTFDASQEHFKFDLPSFTIVPTKARRNFKPTCLVVQVIGIKRIRNMDTQSNMYYLVLSDGSPKLEYPSASI